MVNHILFTTLVLLLLSTTSRSHKQKKCHNFKHMSVSDECSKAWGSLRPQLHPTQVNLGFSWVKYKALTVLNSNVNAQKEMNKKIVPVCLGFGHEVWLLDHHHVLAALDYGNYDSVLVTIHIVCDFSNSTSLASFWETMHSKELAYRMTRSSNTSLPSTLLPWQQMPTTISFNTSLPTPFSDDPWRSLVGFSRKILKESGCTQASGEYCNRAFVKVCNQFNRGTPFFEFRWGYFFNDAYLNAFWNVSNFKVFQRAFYLLPDASSNAAINVQSIQMWENASQLLVPLARSAAAGLYEVPANQEGCVGRLPGFVSGLHAIAIPDPHCELPVCSDFPPEPTGSSSKLY